jgi:hypothetical protein
MTSTPLHRRCRDHRPGLHLRRAGGRDHAALMTWAERWGGAAGTYRDFARAYGADLRESSPAKELAALRLLAPTLDMVLEGASDPACAAEARVRLR